MAYNTPSFLLLNIRFLSLKDVQVTYVYTFFVNGSSVDESTKEKLAPFASITGDESYASRDLEKVCSQVLSSSTFLI